MGRFGAGGGLYILFHLEKTVTHTALDSSGPARAAKILLVEDNPGDVLLTRKALERSGILFELQVASDGIEALTLLRARRPDVVLLDLNLPKMSGREVLDTVKRDEDLRRVPVLILTSSKAEEDVLRSYNMHANGYMVKPGDAKTFTDLAASLGEFWFRQVELPPA